MLKWFRSWRKPQKMLNAMDEKIHRVLQLKARHDQEVAKTQKRLAALEEDMLKEMRKLRQMMDDGDAINRKLSETVDSLRDELNTCREIVIPGLVAANRTFQTSWDSQTAHNALMQVAADTKREEQ